MQALGVPLEECLDPPESLDTARKVFERKIRYWACRPLPQNLFCVTSPSDAKLLIGSLHEQSSLFIKGKFFSFEELLGCDRAHWLTTFDGGDFALFRLTPEKYHYNHIPVSGRVEDIYELAGHYHSCNPAAVVAIATPYSKNKRVVTIINTDVPAGTKVGMVAMIEVVALMIGEIQQRYSEYRYDDPQPIRAGLFVQRGSVKSLYRPGSSTNVVLFEKNRVRFDLDLVRNRARQNVWSRFSQGFGKPLIETEVRARSSIARPAN